MELPPNAVKFDLGPLQLVCQPQDDDFVLVGKLIDAMKGRVCAAMPIKSRRYLDRPTAKAALVIGLEMLVENLRKLASRIDAERRILSTEKTT